MNAKRQRMTWAALDREAAAPPATPGYGVEDQDHPAHEQDDPGSAPYMIGGPSEFGEDVRKPPYGDSGKPALPGYGVEDQDHPAHEGQVGRQANNLMGLVRKKAAKALKLAQHTLGKKADWASVEDQAFNFMSMEDSALDASLQRMSGGFLAEDESMGDNEPKDAFLDPSGDDFIGPDGLLVDPSGDDIDDGNPIMARLKAMETEIQSLRQAGRRADQNDPAGSTLGTSGKSEDEEKKEEAAVSNKAARAKLARLFTACDMDGDGFVTKEDWMGPPEVFASLDTDRDGILAKHEVLAGEVPEAFKKNWDKDDDKKDDDKKDDKKDDKSDKEASKKKAGKKSDDDEDESDKEASKKSDDDEDKSDKEASKKKAALKEAFGQMADFDDEELDMLAAMQGGMDDDDDVTACGDVMAGKKAEDESDDEAGAEAGDEGSDDSDKEASFFDTGFDPMGLADGTHLTAADKAAFEEVFGKQAGDDDAGDDAGDDDAGDDEGKSEKEANQRLASLLKPQPRKASTGVKTVGNVGKTASGRSEVAELAGLWASDPDVSSSFS